MVSREFGEQVEIRVADRGPGVPDEVKETVVEPLVRAEDSDARVITVRSPQAGE